MLGAAGIRTFVATSPDTARGALADAANAALHGGAAALLLPVNVQLADMNLAKAPPPSAPARPRPPAEPRSQAIEAATALLRPHLRALTTVSLDVVWVLARIGSSRARRVLASDEPQPSCP